ncbi:MAG: rhodanese-like domain-containing protein [Acidimicrobiia bacterium]
MPTTIHRNQVQRLMESDAQLVEVLPLPEYEWAHLAGAVNLTLKELDESAAEQLDRGRPVVV